MWEEGWMGFVLIKIENKVEEEGFGVEQGGGVRMYGLIIQVL